MQTPLTEFEKQASKEKDRGSEGKKESKKKKKEKEKQAEKDRKAFNRLQAQQYDLERSKQNSVTRDSYEATQSPLQRNLEPYSLNQSQNRNRRLSRTQSLEKAAGGTMKLFRRGLVSMTKKTFKNPATAQQKKNKNKALRAIEKLKQKDSNKSRA